MPFTAVGWFSPRTRQADGVEIAPQERAVLGVCEAIELQFGVVNGVGQGIGVLDGGPYHQRRMGGLGVFIWSTGLNDILSVFKTKKCIRLMREKFILLYRQYINGSVVYWSLLRSSLLRDRRWHLQEIC